MKKIFLGIMACSALMIGMSACGNKAEANQDVQDTAAEVVEEEALALPDSVYEDVALAAVLDQLTADNDTVKRPTQIYVTPSGLKFRVVKEGTGKAPKAYNVVDVNYEGKLTDGKTFDSSYERGQSIQFPLQNVIPGWTEGLQYMKEGGVYEFYIPSQLAYGERGAGADIAPNSDLLFKVELIKVVQ